VVDPFQKGLFSVNPSTMSWVVMMVYVSLGEVFGILWFN
jgi:hypothetical protein